MQKGRIWLKLVAIFLILGILLPGCAGGGGGTNTSSSAPPPNQDGLNIADTNGKISLPAGAPALTSLRVLSSFGTSNIDGNGNFAIPVNSLATQLVSAVDFRNNLRLLGLSSGSSKAPLELSPRTTAVALIFLFPGFATADPDDSSKSLEIIENLAEISAVESAISLCLQNNTPFGQSQELNDALTKAVSSALQRLLNGGAPNPNQPANGTEPLVNTAKTSENPSLGPNQLVSSSSTTADNMRRSNLELSDVDDNDSANLKFELLNYGHRFVQVYRQETDNQGNPIPGSQEEYLGIAPSADISLKSAFGAPFTGEMKEPGHYALEGKVSSPKNKLKFSIWGPGLKDQSSVSFEQYLQHASQASLATIFFNFIMPALDAITGIKNSEKVIKLPGQERTKLIQEFMQDLEEVVGTANLIKNLQEGKLGTVLFDVLNAVIQNEKLYLKLAQKLAVTGLTSAAVSGILARIHPIALAASTAYLTFFGMANLSSAFATLGTSRPLEYFYGFPLEISVRLDPPAPLSAPGGTLLLTCAISKRITGAVNYHWNITGQYGYIRDNNHAGNDFDSPSKSVTYVAKVPGGQDTITVKVYLSTGTYLGEAKSVVTILRTGKILFGTYAMGPISFYMMNLDGSGLTKILPPNGGHIYGHPRFSPDGTKIAFFSHVSRSFFRKDYYLTLVNTDGSGSITILENPNFAVPYGYGFPRGHLSWSPDGKQLAFSMEGLKMAMWSTIIASFSDVWSINVNGSGLTRLTNAQEVAEQATVAHRSHMANFAPLWSPDSTKIAFIHEGSDIATATALYFMNPSGSGQTKLKDLSVSLSEDWWEDPHTLKWSPDGARIFFSHPELQQQNRVHVLKAISLDGKEEEAVVEGPFAELFRVTDARMDFRWFNDVGHDQSGNVYTTNGIDEPSPWPSAMVFSAATANTAGRLYQWRFIKEYGAYLLFVQDSGTLDPAYYQWPWLTADGQVVYTAHTERISGDYYIEDLFAAPKVLLSRTAIPDDSGFLLINDIWP